MYEGYLALGGEELDDPRVELINNTRLYAYVDTWNRKVGQGSVNGCEINFLTGCGTCPEVGLVFSDGEGYLAPEVDPAPWYDVDVPGSDRFFGVLGISVEGDEDVTRTAEVRQGVGLGGFISTGNYQAREMTVTLVAVAADDCGLAAGMEWVRDAFTTELDPCFGDYLWFLQCCPDCSVSDFTVGPCWVANIGEFDSSPPAGCEPGTWWPSTFQELLDGPSPAEDEWCAWVTTMGQLESGLPNFSCNLAACALPHIRQFKGARVTEGPKVVSRQEMTKGAVIATLEMVIVAADPTHYTPTGVLAFGSYVPADRLDMAGRTMSFASSAPEVNPFSSGPQSAVQRAAAIRRTAAPAKPSLDDWQWDEQVIDFAPPRITSMAGLRADIVLEAVDAGASHVRVGIWNEDQTEQLGGWYVPELPARGAVRIDGPGQRSLTVWNGEMSFSKGDVLDYNGGPVVRYPTLRAGGKYKVVIGVKRGEKSDLAYQLGSAEVGGT